MNPKYLFILLCVWLFSLRCSNDHSAILPQASGEFTLLTYNVAGLPQGISSGNPGKNIPLMSPLLNRYNLVLVQEDFAFHEPLKAQAQHPFQTTPQAKPPGFFLPDGLNRFSAFPFTTLFRTTWTNCSNNDGNDCFAAKGFSMAATTLAPGAVVDIYNLHLDSGSSPQDVATRKAQVEQLLRFLNTRSAGKAVIIAGDINLNPWSRPLDADALQRLLAAGKLTDTCELLDCGVSLVDRVLFRSSTTVRIRPLAWQIDSAFVDEKGQPLSDHQAVSVTIQWQAP